MAEIIRKVSLRLEESGWGVKTRKAILKQDFSLRKLLLFFTCLYSNAADIWSSYKKQREIMIVTGEHSEEK